MKIPQYYYVDNSNGNVVMLTDDQLRAIASRNFLKASDLGVPFDVYMQLIYVI